MAKRVLFVRQPAGSEALGAKKFPWREIIALPPTSGRPGCAVPHNRALAFAVVTARAAEETSNRKAAELTRAKGRAAWSG